MSTKILKGSIELGNKIRGRRNELSLTIEEAAKKLELVPRHGVDMN